MTKLMNRMVENHKLIRRLFLAYTAILTSWVTYQVFDDVTQINASVAAAFATQFGLATLLAGYYFKKRAEENERAETNRHEETWE